MDHDDILRRVYSPVSAPQEVKLRTPALKPNCARMCVCVCAPVYVLMCVYVLVLQYIYIYIHTYIHTYINVYMHINMCTDK